MKNIHEAAAMVLNLPELPGLKNSGLCYLLSRYVSDARSRSYRQIGAFMPGEDFLPYYGLWTDQRLNIICLLAITSPEDFE